MHKNNRAKSIYLSFQNRIMIVLILCINLSSQPYQLYSLTSKKLNRIQVSTRELVLISIGSKLTIKNSLV